MYTLRYGAHVGDMSSSNRKGLKQEKEVQQSLKPPNALLIVLYFSNNLLTQIFFESALTAFYKRTGRQGGHGI